MSESATNPTQELPVVYTRGDPELVQSNPVQREVIQLRKTLTNQENTVVYQQAVEGIWKLFKQVVALFYKLFLVFFALIIWVWGIGFESGYNFRKWMEDEQPTIEDILLRLLKLIFWPFKRLYEWANAFIKEHLGWDNPLNSKSPSTTPED